MANGKDRGAGEPPIPATAARDRRDLLQPTIPEKRETEGPAPWSLWSQFFVAFFGGVIASTAIAYLNARRLGLGQRERRSVLLLGLVGLIAVVMLAVVQPESGQGLIEDIKSSTRLAGRAVAVLLYVPVAALQRRGDRLFVFRGGVHGSLWRPGLAAVFIGGILQTVIVALVLVLR